jgi:pyruvate dehydrogenase E1 component alpha subunit
MSDPAKYRTKEELEEYKGMDPIEQVRKSIIDKKYASEDDLKEIEKKKNQQVDEAIQFADESPYPEPEEALKDVYEQKDYPFILD